MKYYVCEHCGNIIEFVKEFGVPVMCCGQQMMELVPGTTDVPKAEFFLWKGDEFVAVYEYCNIHGLWKT